MVVYVVGTHTGYSDGQCGITTTNCVTNDCRRRSAIITNQGGGGGRRRILWGEGELARGRGE